MRGLIGAIHILTYPYINIPIPKHAQQEREKVDGRAAHGLVHHFVLGVLVGM